MDGSEGDDGLAGERERERESESESEWGVRGNEWATSQLVVS